MTAFAAMASPNSPAAKTRDPATSEGEARTRRFVLPPGEDPEFFTTFAEGIWSAYGPEDQAEQALVEMLVAALWQAIRADRLEAELLAAIPPAHKGHSHGSALIGEPEHRAALATVLRYQATAGHAVRRAMDGFLKHRKARRAGLIGGEAEEERRADPNRPHPNPPPPSAREGARGAAEGARGAAAADVASPPPSPSAPPSLSPPPAPPPLTPPPRHAGEVRVGASSSPPASLTHNAVPDGTNEPDTRPTAPAACTNEPDARPMAPAACTNEPNARPTAPATCTPEPAPRRDRGEPKPAAAAQPRCTNEPAAKPAAPPTPAKKPITYWAKEPLPPHLRSQQPPAPGRR